MATPSKVPWDKLKADALREICRENPGKRKRQCSGLDEVLKLNIEDKDGSSPRRPSAKRAHPAEERPAASAPEGAGTPSASQPLPP